MVARYGREDDPRWIARLFRSSVEIAVAVIALAGGVHFPERTTGGWHWGARWRLEWLLSWNERSSVAWLRTALPRGGCFLDLGAHIGYYARIGADVVGRGGRILAVEPHPENLAVLRKNLVRRPQVLVAPVAVGEAAGEMRLWESPGSSNHSLYQGFTGSARCLDVQVVPVDELVALHGLGRVDVVKIDVEGGEISALRGLRQTLRDWRPALLIERNPRALAAAGSSAHALLELLDELDYEAFEIADDGMLTPAAAGGPDAAQELTINLVCTPRTSGAAG